MEKSELVGLALKARQKAYAPYSHFLVGAALLAQSGRAYQGCNIENAAYTPSCCAERTAFFKAVSAGEREFSAIAIAGGREDTGALEICAPCGVCRQVMEEFCDADTFEIILGTESGTVQTYKLKELLPLGFGAKNLG